MKKIFKKPAVEMLQMSTLDGILTSTSTFDIKSVKSMEKGDTFGARQHGAGAAAIGNNPVSSTQLLDF